MHGCDEAVVTYVSTAAQSGDQQHQRPQATHQSRGGEALSPAATASSSPHARPCRSRRGEGTDLQKGEEERCAGLLTSPSSASSSSLFSPSSPPRVRRGMKAQLNAGRRKGDWGGRREGGRKCKSVRHFYFFPGTNPRDLTSSSPLSLSLCALS